MCGQKCIKLSGRRATSKMPGDQQGTDFPGWFCLSVKLISNIEFIPRYNMPARNSMASATSESKIIKSIHNSKRNEEEPF